MLACLEKQEQHHNQSVVIERKNIYRALKAVITPEELWYNMCERMLIVNVNVNFTSQVKQLVAMATTEHDALE